LTNFLAELTNFEDYQMQKQRFVQIITDDVSIQAEINMVSDSGFIILKPEPAPKRIPDKV